MIIQITKFPQRAIGSWLIVSDNVLGLHAPRFVQNRLMRLLRHRYAVEVDGVAPDTYETRTVDAEAEYLWPEIHLQLHRQHMDLAAERKGVALIADIVQVPPTVKVPMGLTQFSVGVCQDARLPGGDHQLGSGAGDAPGPDDPDHGAEEGPDWDALAETQITSRMLRRFWGTEEAEAASDVATDWDDDW